MSEKNLQETPVPPVPQAPPAYHPTYPIPAPMPMPVPVPMPVPYGQGAPPPKNETPGFPPDELQRYHEQMLATQCARGQHDPTTKFGICGIVWAIICFPFGLLCLCADKEVKCARCGLRLN